MVQRVTHLAGHRTALILALCALLLLLCSPLQAQKDKHNGGGATAVGVYAGAYSTGSGEWPRVAVEMLADSGEIGGGRSLNLGAWYIIRQ